VFHALLIKKEEEHRGLLHARVAFPKPWPSCQISTKPVKSLVKLQADHFVSPVIDPGEESWLPANLFQKSSQNKSVFPPHQSYMASDSALIARWSFPPATVPGQSESTGLCLCYTTSLSRARRGSRFQVTGAFISPSEHVCIPSQLTRSFTQSYHSQSLSCTVPRTSDTEGRTEDTL